MDTDRAYRGLLLSEHVYTASRVALAAAAWVLLAVARADDANNVMNWFTVAGATLVSVVTVGLAVAARVRDIDFLRVLIWSIPFDLLALGALTVGLHGLEDPVYPALLALPVFYSYVIRRREIWMLAAASAVTYLVAHAFAHPVLEWTAYLVFAIKAVAIVYVGSIAAFAAARHRDRQLEIERSTAEREDLAEQLRRRLSELQAVSQISEVIHSSLEFDRVGPLVLQILRKVIDIPSCCLFVIDKPKAETLFSASAGLDGSAVRVPPGGVGALDVGDAHFTCMSVLDHKHMMVVFCAPADALEELTDEDRIVLQAVSSELVVAVENSQLYKLTRRLAITDELTGLHNYRHLQNRLDEEIERARRYRKDVSLLMIDADDFKRFNDTHGHIAGDRALAEFGDLLRSRVREVDLVARYGGEEFSVVLPETDAAGAFVVAEKIREAVAHHEFEDAEGTRGPRLTVSVGVATFPAHAQDRESLLRQADGALYSAKHGGKNRVRSPQPLRNPAPPASPETLKTPAGPAAPAAAGEDPHVREDG